MPLHTRHPTYSSTPPAVVAVLLAVATHFLAVPATPRAEPQRHAIASPLRFLARSLLVPPSDRHYPGSTCSSSTGCGDHLECYNMAFTPCSLTDDHCLCVAPCDGPGDCPNVCGTYKGGSPICFKCNTNLSVLIVPYGGDECGGSGKPCRLQADCNARHACVGHPSGLLCEEAPPRSDDRHCRCGLSCTATSKCGGKCGYKPNGPNLCWTCATQNVTVVGDLDHCSANDTVEEQDSPTSSPDMAFTTPVSSPAIALPDVETPSTSPLPQPAGVNGSSGGSFPEASPEIELMEEPVLDDAEDASSRSEPCIDASLLSHLPSTLLVYKRHRRASVLCDAHGSCATFGHIVSHNGRAMMMGSYCRAFGPCTRRVMQVNSPRMRTRLRIGSKTENLVFTPFSARHETKVEEILLSTLVRAGL